MSVLRNYWVDWENVEQLKKMICGHNFDKIMYYRD